MGLFAWLLGSDEESDEQEYEQDPTYTRVREVLTDPKSYQEDKEELDREADRRSWLENRKNKYN